MTKMLAHDEAFDLLPWFVNGTLSEAEHAGVDRHVRSCLPCRIALQEQQRLQTLLRAQPTVPLSSDPGFERLVGTIDTARPRPRRRHWGDRFARPRADVGRHAVTAAVLVGGLALASWLATIAYNPPQQAPFETLTTGATDGTSIDVILAAGVPEADLRELIREFGGEITSGPSDQGRYTIAFDRQTADAEPDDVLRRLQADARIRFAGPTFIETSEQ